MTAWFKNLKDNNQVVLVSQTHSIVNHRFRLIHFIQVLTAPHMEHGTQWAGRGQSSVRMLPANLWFQPQLILPPQSLLSSLLPCIPTTRGKVHPRVHTWFWLAASLFSKVAIRGSFPAYHALTTTQDICTIWEWAVSPQTHWAIPVSHGRR